MNSLLLGIVATVAVCFAHPPEHPPVEPHPTPVPEPNPTVQACFMNCQTEKYETEEAKQKCHSKCVRQWIGKFKEAELLHPSFCIYQVGQLAYNANLVCWNTYMTGVYTEERFDRYLRCGALVSKVEQWAKYNCRDQHWDKDEMPEK